MIALTSGWDVLNWDNLYFLWNGLLATLGVSLFSIIFSFVVGSILGLIRYENIPYFSKYVGFLIDIVRNLPLLLILFFMYFALPKLGIRLPVFWTSILAFTLFESAMLSEIVRSGLNAVGHGQFEGARANGLSNWQTMYYVILPQAYKKMIPPIVSQFISLVKDTSLAVGILLPELMYKGQIIYGQNTNYIGPVFLVLAIIYFVVNYSLSILAKHLEKTMA